MLLHCGTFFGFYVKTKNEQNCKRPKNKLECTDLQNTLHLQFGDVIISHVRVWMLGYAICIVGKLLIYNLLDYTTAFIVQMSLKQSEQICSDGINFPKLGNSLNNL